MNPTTESTNGTTLHPRTEPPSGVPGPEAKPPTHAVRQAQIWALQTEALRRPDPLRANLGAMLGDLMLLALRIRATFDEDLSAVLNTPEQYRELQQKGDYYLKVTREVSRLVQADQQIARTDRPAKED
jgi:hypothetical protein